MLPLSARTNGSEHLPKTPEAYVGESGHRSLAPRKRSPTAAGIHHSTPIILVSSLLCGVAFSLAHHFFYRSLDGKPALNEDVLLMVSQQTFNLALGNAFAFAVKVSLGVAASTAYFQAFWRTTRTSTRGQSIAALDTTFSALEDVWNLFNVKVWYRYPLMFIIASLAWCVPLASIITPSTLAVQNVLREPALTSNLSTPNLDFASLNFLAPMIYNSSENYWQYFGSNDAVRRIATSTLVGGDILPISAPSGRANASWTTTFWGPSLSCSNATQDEGRKIWYNFLDSIKPTEGLEPPHWPCYSLPAYASWPDDGETWLPFNDDGDLIDNSLSFGKPNRMFVAITPWSTKQFKLLCDPENPANVLSETWQKPDSAKDPYLAELFDTATLLECRAVNASYTVQFDYVNGQQNLSVDIDRSEDLLIPLKNVTGPAVLSSETMTHPIGEASRSDCSTLNTQGIRCMFDVTTLRTLGYQAIVEIFSAVLHGTLTLTNPVAQRLIFYDSDVSKTRLIDTNELSWIPEYAYITAQKDNLTAQLSSQAGADYLGLSNTRPMKSLGSLGEVIEDLFTNFTLSLMSDSYLLPNYSSPFAPQELHNVTLQDYHNVYKYDHRTLWIAYGSAISTTCVIAAVGLILLYMNGSSYDNKFSTVLRVSRNSELTKSTPDKSGDDGDWSDDGRRPLPRDLAKATLVMRCTPVPHEDGDRLLRRPGSSSSS